MALQTDTDRSGAEAGAKGNSSEGRRSAVQVFLDGFARALTAGDGRTAATFWETPALVVHDDAVRPVATQAEVEQFFGGAKEQYNKMGVVETRAEIVRLTWPTDRIAIVEVRWPYLDARNQERGHETSTYTLRRNDSGSLKIRAVAMHGASKQD